MKVEVIFDVDGNRNLTVTAREDSTGSFIKARITEDWLSKINYDDLPSQYKAPSEGGNIQMEELISVQSSSRIAVWYPSSDLQHKY